MSDIKKKLGNKIKQFRKSKRLTQEQLAELIGIEVPSMSNIETGKFAPSIDTLEKLSRALDTPIWEFYLFDVISHKQMVEEISSKIETDKELTIKLYNFLKLIDEI